MVHIVFLYYNIMLRDVQRNGVINVDMSSLKAT